VGAHADGVAVILHAAWNEAVNSREAGASGAVCSEAGASEQGHQSTPREV